MQEIKINFRSSAFTSLTVVAIVMTIVFATLYVQKLGEHKRSVDFVQSLYMGLTFASVMMAIRAIRNMTSKKPQMIINQNGIVDYANLDGLTVEWNHVLKAEITRFGASEVLAIYVDNVADLTKYLKRTKQRVADARTKRLGTPICIATKIHDFDPNAVVTTINNMARAKVGLGS